MPYEYRDGYVYNTATGKRKNKQRLSRERAMRYMRALYAAEPKLKDHSGVIFGLFLPAQVAQQLHQAVLAAGVPNPEPPQDYHITLAYLGDAAELEPQRQKLQEFAVFFGGLLAPISGLVGGTGRFNHSEEDGSNAFYASFDSPALGLIRERLVETLAAHDIKVASNHGFTPHITLAYIPADAPTPTLELPLIEVVFSELTLAWGDEHYLAQLMPALEVAEKAANYSARAGQIIAGRLARGGDGKFTSAGSDIESESKRIVEEHAKRTAGKPKPKKSSSRRGPKRRAASGRKPPAPKKPAKTDEEKRQESDAKRQQRTEERTAEQQKKIQQNRSAVLDGVKGTMQEEQARALLEFNEGKGADPAQLAELTKQGLVEQDKQGNYRMSEAGRNFAAAADRGDVRDAKDALSRGGDRVQGAAEQQARTQERAAAAAKRRAEVEARRNAPKGGRGGGGGSKKPAPALLPELTSAAGKLSAGEELSQTEQELLVRNGLARRTDDGKLVLTATGLRATRQKEASALSVFKDHRGRWRWFAISSTAFRDRDGEIVSTKALEQDVARADATGEYGPLRYWHQPGLDIGDCDFNAVVGRSLLESGTFRSEQIGAMFAEKAEQHQISLGFLHPLNEPDRDGVFWNIRRIERSPVPRGRVSNVFTHFLVKEAVMPLTEEKRKAFLDLAGDSAENRALLEQLITQVEHTEKGADARGVAYKADEPADVAVEAEAKAEAPVVEVPVEEVEEPGGPFFGDLTLEEAGAFIDARLAAAIGPLLHTKLEGSIGELKSMLSGAQATKDAELASIKEAQATDAENLRTALKEAQDLATKAQQQAAAIDARLKTLEGEQPAGSRGYRASQDASTVLPEGSRLKEGQPQPDPLAPHLTAIMGALSQPPQ